MALFKGGGLLGDGFEEVQEVNAAPPKPQGGTKFDTGKCRLDLLPLDALWCVGEVYSMGARKYDPWNWAKGIKYSRIIAALLRHLFKFVMGERYDQEDGQHHLASVIWCGLSLLHYDLNSEDFAAFDDRRTRWARVWEKKINPQKVQTL